MTSGNESTRLFPVSNDAQKAVIRNTLFDVEKALKGKGYRPIDQIVGYLMSGDPAYITSQDGARTKIKKIERDELIEELVRFYLENNTP